MLIAWNLMSHFLVLRLLSNMISPTNRTTAITLPWEKDSLVFVNVYRGKKKWNKAIHNALTLPLVLTWYCHASQNTKMAAEVFPQMTSYIKNSRWRPDLLKACIANWPSTPFRASNSIISKVFALM